MTERQRHRDEGSVTKLVEPTGRGSRDVNPQQCPGRNTGLRTKSPRSWIKFYFFVLIHALKLFSCLVVLRFKKILETLTFTRRMIRKTSLPLQSWWSIDSSSAMAPAPLQRKYSYWRQTDARERSGADLTSTLPLMIIMIIIIPTTMFMVRIERWTVLKKICTEQWGFKIRHQSADECHSRSQSIQQRRQQKPALWCTSLFTITGSKWKTQTE